jgi:hypothetical protein
VVYASTVPSASSRSRTAFTGIFSPARSKPSTRISSVASESSRTGGRCAAGSGAATKVTKCAAGQVRVMFPGRPGGVCAPECGSICPGGENSVELTSLNDDGTPGRKVDVPPSALPPRLAQCAPGQHRVIAPGKPGGVCKMGCGSTCAGVDPVEATLLKDDGTPGGKVNVEP